MGLLPLLFLELPLQTPPKSQAHPASTKSVVWQGCNCGSSTQVPLGNAGGLPPRTREDPPALVEKDAGQNVSRTDVQLQEHQIFQLPDPGPHGWANVPVSHTHVPARCKQPL
ncbi:unnamed protein product [Eretmochelys imbricata]